MMQKTETIGDSACFVYANIAWQSHIGWVYPAHDAITHLLNFEMASLHYPGQSSTAPLSKTQPCERHFSASASRTACLMRYARRVRFSLVLKARHCVL